MTEAKIVTEIKHRLTKSLQVPPEVIFKLQDYMTAGIPDLAINYHGRTTWVEVKLLREGESFSKFRQHFDKLQLATARLLERQAPTFYFIAYPLDKMMNGVIFRPTELDTFLKGVKTFDVGAFYGSGARYIGHLDLAIGQLSEFIRTSSI